MMSSLSEAKTAAMLQAGEHMNPYVLITVGVIVVLCFIGAIINMNKKSDDERNL